MNTTIPASPIPASLQAEHQQLKEQLDHATREPGALGAAAREVSRLMKGHFDKEERYSLPPLTLLPRLAWGTVSDDMTGMLAITKRLKAELPLMLIEHKQIAEAARRLLFEATQAGCNDCESCAVALLAHAQQEEEVHYPAAVLVGEYLALKLGLQQEA